MPDFWGLSSVGRAPALQAGGREFESLRLHSRYLDTACTLKTSYSICRKEGPKRVKNYDKLQLTKYPFGRMPYDKATLRSNVGKL